MLALLPLFADRLSGLTLAPPLFMLVEDILMLAEDILMLVGLPPFPFEERRILLLSLPGFLTDALCKVLMSRLDPATMD